MKTGSAVIHFVFMISPYTPDHEKGWIHQRPGFQASWAGGPPTKRTPDSQNGTFGDVSHRNIGQRLKPSQSLCDRGDQAVGFASRRIKNENQA